EAVRALGRQRTERPRQLGLPPAITGLGKMPIGREVLAAGARVQPERDRTGEMGGVPGLEFVAFFCAVNRRLAQLRPWPRSEPLMQRLQGWHEAGNAAAGRGLARNARADFAWNWTERWQVGNDRAPAVQLIRPTRTRFPIQAGHHPGVV